MIFYSSHLGCKLQVLIANCLFNIYNQIDLNRYMSKIEFWCPSPKPIPPLRSSPTQEKKIIPSNFRSKPGINRNSSLCSICQRILFSKSSKWPEFDHFSSLPLPLLLLFKLLLYHLLCGFLQIKSYLVSSLLPSLPSISPKAIFNTAARVISRDQSHCITPLFHDLE